LAVLVAFTAVAGAQDTTAAPVKPDSVAKPTPDTVAKPKPDTTPKPVHIASPYQDFNQLQAFQLDVGYFAGNTGDAGVGPQGAPIANLSYGLHLGGAAFGFGTIGYTNSKRTVLDFVPINGSHVIGTISDPLILANLGVLLALTGEKTWHNMVPFAGFTAGVAVSTQPPDVAGYEFGTKFFFGLGAGLRYRLKRPWVLNVSLWDYLWQLHYPQSYFNQGPVNSVLPPNSPNQQFLNNGVFTVGLTYVFKSL
jgi:hypothetical protein